MAGITPDPWSLTTVFLEAHRPGLSRPIATGSGFLVSPQGSTFLISAWHVVTCRHVDTRESLHAQCAIPEFIRADPLKNPSPGTWEPVDIPVENWLEHPDRRRCCDVVAAPVPELEHGWAHQPVEDRLVGLGLGELVIGDDVFVLGFPYGLKPTAGLPLWKRGSVASEPTARVHGKDGKMLIDIGGRNGMSGGLVIRCEWDRDNSLCLPTRITEPLGLYSGRLSPPGDVAGHAGGGESTVLGIVWRWHVVLEVLNKGVPLDPNAIV